MPFVWQDDYRAALASAITAAQTTLALSAAPRALALGESLLLTLGSGLPGETSREVVRVDGPLTEGTTTVGGGAGAGVVTRAVDGTTASVADRAWASGTPVQGRLHALALGALVQEDRPSTSLAMVTDAPSPGGAQAGEALLDVVTVAGMPGLALVDSFGTASRRPWSRYALHPSDWMVGTWDAAPVVNEVAVSGFVRFDFSGGGAWSAPGSGSTFAETPTASRQIAGAANSYAGWRSSVTASAMMFWRGPAAGRGGFYVHARVGHGALPPNTRAAFGLFSSPGGADAPTIPEPSALIHPGVGVIVDSTDTEYHLWYHDGTTGTKVPIGGNPRGVSALLDLVLFAPPQNASGTAPLCVDVGIFRAADGYNRVTLWSGEIPAPPPGATRMRPYFALASHTHTAGGFGFLGAFCVFAMPRP